jgi:uncharacterized protein (TIGR00251 family)
VSVVETKDGVLLTVYVKPNSSKFKLELVGDEIVVYVTQEPERGKVNREILKELTKTFHAKVELASGATSREKKLLVIGKKKTDIEPILNKSFDGNVK